MTVWSNQLAQLLPTALKCQIFSITGICIKLCEVLQQNFFTMAEAKATVKLGLTITGIATPYRKYCIRLYNNT